MHQTIPYSQRVYLMFKQGADGRVTLSFSLMPPPLTSGMVALLVRGVIYDGALLSLPLVSDPTQDEHLRGPAGKDGSNGIDGASAYQIARAAGYGGTQTQWLASLRATDGKDGKNGLDGKSAAALLGTVTIGQTATVALTAGVRRLVITVPTSMGLAAGDPLALAPTKAIDGYAIHDAIAVSSTSINVGLTAPLLAIGASFSIPAKLFRLNT
ncbi:hypothetical protein [Sphingomonas faeni]|uniref:hypothetical protein n=1 Tax=Sphingomonas faeni TaxID=185950 RepID=UPI00335C4FEA